MKSKLTVLFVSILALSASMNAHATHRHGDGVAIVSIGGITVTGGAASENPFIVLTGGIVMVYGVVALMVHHFHHYDPYFYRYYGMRSDVIAFEHTGETSSILADYLNGIRDGVPETAKYTDQQMIEAIDAIQLTALRTDYSE